MEKAELIYSYNNESPLFAIIAKDRLEKGKVEEAISILVKGLEVYPGYVTAYFLLGISFAKIDEKQKAAEMIKKGGELLESNDAVNYYLNLIGQTDDIEVVTEDKEENVLAKEINEEILPAKEENEPEEEIEAPMFISETLANIYLAQSGYSEALDVFEKLIEKEPEKTDYYNSKIEEIKELMKK